MLKISDWNLKGKEVLALVLHSGAFFFLHFTQKMNAGSGCTKNLSILFSFILLQSGSLQQRFPKWMLRPLPNRP
jgi:hypothetical protein